MSDTIKLLEENTGRILYDINCSNIFLDLSPRVVEIKTKLNKWDLTELKKQRKPNTKKKNHLWNESNICK